jgi:hypothetical protein
MNRTTNRSAKRTTNLRAKHSANTQSALQTTAVGYLDTRRVQTARDAQRCA